MVKEGALGAILTGLMVLLFLRDLRGALIVVLNIPISIAASLLALWVTGETVNLMTLGGLALAIGVLVDEATVTMENIHARRGQGGSLAKSVLTATEETTGPRFLAMLCVLAVFVPSFFMEGTAKALFVPLALAVGFSMAASYLLSSTLVPVLAVWWGGKAVAAAHENKPGVLQRMYAGLLKPLVLSRHLVLPGYLVVMGLLISQTFPRLGNEIFPQIDAGQIQLRMRLPAGTKLDKTEAVALRILDVLKEEAGADKVAITMGLVGVHAPNYPVNLIHQWNSGPEEAVLQIQLKDGSGVRVAELREKLRARLKTELPEAELSFEPADIVSRVMAMGSPTPIEVAVSGKDFAASRAHAETLKKALAVIPALRDVQFGQTLDYPSVEVQVDREKAGLMGVRMSDTTRSLVAATASSRFTVPNYWADTKTGVSYSLQVQVPQTQMTGLEDLRNLPITSSTQGVVPLRNFAKVTEGNIVGQYDRYNMARTVSITANLHGADLGSVARQVEAVLAATPAPAGVNVALRGQVPPMRQLQEGLRMGLLTAVVVIFLLLVANFQSIRLSLAVVSAVPAVLLGVVMALQMSGTTLNIQSFMGAIMAVGVAVANAILLVTFAHRDHLSGLSRNEAAISGASSRLRPIMMTSLAMMAGMVPMAMSGGQAAPLGRAVLGGLAFGTLATLLILPAAFAFFSSKTARSAALDTDLD